MRDAAIRDGWRRTSQIERYPLQLISASFEKVKGFNDGFSIDFSSGLTAICGKNGVGKSTLLKVIYESLFDNISHHKVTPDSRMNLNVVKNGENISKGTLLSSDVYYMDPSFECSKIINFISSTNNFDEFLEGVEPNGFLNKPKVIKSVSNCVGKPYKAINIYEIENAIDDEYTFPFFSVELNDGTQYTSLSMGMGEHLCMFLLWFIEWIEPESILLLEELENYLAAYSQRKLVDYLAVRLSDKKVWTIVTTHSEHVLNKIGIKNTRILYRKGVSSLSVNPESSDKYLRALGISLNKKGVYFVEDFFASLTFKALVNYLEPDLLDVRDVIGLRCDSNMEKVVKHYQPSSKVFFDLMAIFDADQSSKINSLAGKDVGAICLPSTNKVAPEEEIWSTLEAFTSEIAGSLSIRPDRLDEAIDEFRYEDHHERYHQISSSIHVTFEQLTSAIIKQWLSNYDNLLLANKFIIALILRGDHVDLEQLLSIVSEYISDASIVEEIKNQFESLNAKSVTVYFDGENLNLVKAA